MRYTFAAISCVSALGAVLTCSPGAQQPDYSKLVQGISLSTDKCKIGEPVAIRYSVQNKAAQPIVLSFPTSKHFDIWIQRGGAEPYRFSRGKVYLQVLTSLTIQPGETITFSTTWDQTDSSGRQAGPGVYDVYAQLTTSGVRPPRASLSCSSAPAPPTHGNRQAEKIRKRPGLPATSARADCQIVQV